jgi:antitoxin HigA-1
MSEKRISPIHPGEVLQLDYLEPMGISQNALSRAMRVPVNRISEICNGKRAITADTALRLSLAIGTTAKFWMNLQTSYDLDAAMDKSGGNLEREVLPLAAQD